MMVPILLSPRQVNNGGLWSNAHLPTSLMLLLTSLLWFGSLWSDALEGWSDAQSDAPFNPF